MKSFRAKALIKLIAIIACAALSSCAADGAVGDSTHIDAGADATQSEGDATLDAANDTTTPDPDADSEAPHTPDANTPDAPDSGDIDPQEPDVTEEPGRPAGQTCEVAIDATAGGVWEDRTTEGAGDDYNAPYSSAGGVNCPAGNMTMGDEAFVLSPENDTTYRVTVSSMDTRFSPIVYIRDDCSQPACIGGSKMVNSDGVLQLDAFEVPGGASYYVIVDTDLVSSEGAYKIEVEIR